MRSSSFPYDRSLRPPAPSVALRVASPLRSDGVMLRALLDTGADCTLIPLRVAQRLRLPRVGRIRITGVTGDEKSASLHAARLQVAGVTSLTRIAALGDETIIGRDLLNQWRVALDGPKGVTTLRAPRRK